MTERERFDAWSYSDECVYTMSHHESELAFHVWQAAILAERERAAKLCEGRAGMRGTGAWVALTAAADAIREGTE